MLTTELTRICNDLSINSGFGTDRDFAAYMVRKTAKYPIIWFLPEVDNYDSNETIKHSYTLSFYVASQAKKDMLPTEKETLRNELNQVYETFKKRVNIEGYFHRPENIPFKKINFDEALINNEFVELQKYSVTIKTIR